MNWAAALVVGAIVGGLLGGVTATISIRRTKPKESEADE